MVRLTCVACLLLLPNLVAPTFGQNNTDVTSTSSLPDLPTPTTLVAPTATATAPSSSQHPAGNGSCSTDVSLVGGVAVGSFIAGVMVGLLGVCVLLVCVKRPCSWMKDVEPTQRTQRFTRSEAEKTHGQKGEYEFLPIYHVKQNQNQLATAGGDEEEEDGGGEEEKEEEDKMSIHKGPLPPPPAAPPPPPLPSPPPAFSPPVFQKTCTKEYAIPHITSSTNTKRETLLEEYDIPDVSIPLSLTGNLSKSQILTSNPSFPGKDNKNREQRKKPLNASLSVDNLPEAASSSGTEHYYVMDPSPKPSSGAVGNKPRVSPQPARQKQRKPLKASASFNCSQQLEGTLAAPHTSPEQLPPSTHNPVPPRTKRSRQPLKPPMTPPPAKQQIAPSHSKKNIAPPPGKLVTRNPELTPQMDPSPLFMRHPPPPAGPPPPPAGPPPPTEPPIHNPHPLPNTPPLAGPPRVRLPPLRPPLVESTTQQAILDGKKMLSRTHSSKALPPVPSAAVHSLPHSYSEPLEYDNFPATKRLAMNSELASIVEQKGDPFSSSSPSPLSHTTGYANIGRVATLHGLKK